MIRVLMVADGGWPTGFERVARGIGTHLQSTGKFHVIHRGLGYGPNSKNRVDEYPYEIKPTIQTGDDPLAVTQMPVWIAEDKPDVILMIQDLWNQTNYLGHVPREIPTVGYYPVDTPNIKWSYAMGAAALTEAVPYTSFGAVETALGVRDAVEVVLDAYAAQGMTLEEQATWMTLPKEDMELHLRLDRMVARQDPSGYAPIAHGVDHDKFFPMDKLGCRNWWGFPEDAFIVLNVNTNQFRKRQDLTIRAFSEVARRVPNAFLVLHCMGGNDKEGWDLGQLARLYGVQDRVVCTHWSYPELTDAQLRMLYNTADVQVNTGGGEGWGLTAVEGALCGVAQAVPDWSATREIWRDAGVLFPVSDYRFEPKYINTAHAIIDARLAAECLVELAEDPEKLKQVSERCLARALAMPTWDDVGRAFASRIESALLANVESAPAIRLLDLRSSRREALKSELSLHL